MIQHEASAHLPTEYGDFDFHVFQDPCDHAEIIVLAQLKKIEGKPLVRLHSACATGDLFHSKKCDCGEQLSQALVRIHARGGLLMYLPQEGRGVGLVNKIKAYALQDKLHLDTVDANLTLGLPIDARNYNISAEILRYFNLLDITLLSNNPEKFEALTRAGIQVQRESLTTTPSPENQAYIQTKLQKLGHLE